MSVTWLIVVSLTVTRCATAATTDPLIFEHFRDNPDKVRLIWNPTLSIAHVLQIAQREVVFEEDPITGGPKSVFHPWRVLVTAAQGHDDKNRYVFLKDNPCTELDFQLSYRTRNGDVVKDVVQTLKSIPSERDLKSKVRLKSLQTRKSKIEAVVDWMADLSDWDELKAGPIAPTLDLKECRTLFKETVPFPKVSNDGKKIEFDMRYAHHNCSFDYRLGFPIWQNDTSCKRDVIGSQSETLTIRLSCDTASGVKCPTPRYKCDMDCSPKDVWIEPSFEVTENATEVSVNLNWSFQKPANLYAIRHYHSWLHYRNQAFDNDNATAMKVNTTEVTLEATSVIPVSMWVAQICALYSPCKQMSWSDIPSHPVPYFELHDARPTWPTPLPVQNASTTKSFAPAKNAVPTEKLVQAGGVSGQCQTPALICLVMSSILTLI